MIHSELRDAILILLLRFTLRMPLRRILARL
jgi:hypothetical protein